MQVVLVWIIFVLFKFHHQKFFYSHDPDLMQVIAVTSSQVGNYYDYFSLSIIVIVIILLNSIIIKYHRTNRD